MQHLLGALLLSLQLVLQLSATVGARLPRQANDGITLAVSRIRGPLSGNVSDVNAGIDLAGYRTIVAFGVRFSLLLLIYS